MGTVLDRPFSVRDHEVSLAAIDAGCAREERPELPSVTLHYAELLRVVREHPNQSARFHLANFEHWQEEASDSLKYVAGPASDLVALRLGQMASHIFLEVVKAVHEADRRDEMPEMAGPAQSVHVDHLTHLQRKIHLQDYAISWLDAIHVFAIGTCLCFFSHSIGQLRTDNIPMRMCNELLTVAAERFPDTRVFRDLLAAFADFVSLKDHPGADKLQASLQQTIDSGVGLPNRDRQFIQTTLHRHSHPLPPMDT